MVKQKLKKLKKNLFEDLVTEIRNLQKKNMILT